MQRRLIAFLSIAILFQSCAIRTIESRHTNPPPRNVLAVFMDGTNNKPQIKHPQTNTHVKIIHNFVDSSFRSLYIDGVGSNGNPFGTGWGTSTRQRIAIAYCFLSKYYTKGDSIALFGFSRGANQCRILSNLVYTFGVLDLKNIKSEKLKVWLVKKCYANYTCYKPVSKRREKVAGFLTQWNNDHPGQRVGFDTSGKDKIKLMGLWDTVEAFNLDGDGEQTAPLPHHLNQVKNVEQIFHAASLDDNRSDVYTPIIINDNRVQADPTNRLEEVWFSGSHRDVGGGPKRNGELSTVTLKWMLTKTKDYYLFNDTVSTTYPLGYVHNAALMPIWWHMGWNRNIHEYHKNSYPDTGYRKIKIHRSVIERLEKGKAPKFKTWLIRKDWYEHRPYKSCFIKKGNQIIFKKDCPCIEVVD